MPALRTRRTATTKPAGVTVPTATAGDGLVVLTWFPAARGQDYVVYRLNPATGRYDVRATTTALTYTDTPVTNGTPQTYRVAARNSVGTGALSATATATPTGGASPPPPPSPTVLELDLVDAATDLPVGDLVNGATLIGPLAGVNVEVKASASAVRASITFDGTTRSESNRPYSVFGDDAGNFRPGTIGLGSHTLSVTLYDAANAAHGPFVYTFTVEAEPPPPQPPATPVGLAAAGGNAKVVLLWNASTGATHYEVQRSTDGATWVTLNPSGVITATGYTDAPVANGTTYHYRVRAGNVDGDSAWSSFVSATPSAPLPEPPPPPTDERPTAANTGPRGTLVTSTVLTISTPNTTVSLKKFCGTVLVKANGVTLEDCEVDAGGASYCVNVSTGVTGTKIKHCRLFGCTSATVLGGADMLIERTHIRDSGNDGGKPKRNWTVRWSYVELLGNKTLDPTDPHADGFQWVSGGDCLFEYCNIYMPRLAGYAPNCAFMIQTNTGSINNITIRYCWLGGGGFTIFVRDKGTGYGAPTNVSITDCVFYKGLAGYALLSKSSNATVGWARNFFDDGTVANPSSK